MEDEEDVSDPVSFDVSFGGFVLHTATPVPLGFQGVGLIDGYCKDFVICDQVFLYDNDSLMSVAPVEYVEITVPKSVGDNLLCRPLDLSACGV
jgi:hypothetical protein